MIWNVLDVRAVWIKELASALGEQVSTLGWLPRISSAGILQDGEAELVSDDPALRIRYFPLQRGFARFPVTTIAREGNRIARRLSQRSDDPRSSPLICSSPHYAAVAEQWPGPVLYYVTDLFVAYGNDPAFINSLDQRMCKAADLVCPNSQRIADYLIEEAGCPADRVVVVANATRKASLLTTSSISHVERPRDIADLPEPIAGVIGNLAENTDWELLQETIERTPWLSWIFVGPTGMSITDRKQRRAREFLMEHGGRIRFVGSKSYGALREYARSINVAVLPYRKQEPTYSGSSTRFYEHLATCRPMLATRGFEELRHKEPLLKLIDTCDQLVTELEKLRQTEFRDGYEDLRWRASLRETWDARASTMRKALAEKLSLRYESRPAAQAMRA